MKWAHLPGPGGIYDQHPTLIDRFYYIFQEKAKQDEIETRKRDREMGKSTGRRGAARSPGNHPRR